MGKSKKVTVGYHYEVAIHDGLCLGPLDAFLEWRPGTKTAWSGRITSSSRLGINAPDLWGGKKDQGGVVGTLAVMFGEAGQLPNSYLTGTFGNQTVAWRGIATVAFEGGRYGANNPWPQKRAYKVERIKQGWDDGCWYEAKAAVLIAGDAYAGFEDLAWVLPSMSGLSLVSDEFTLTGNGSSSVQVTLSLSGRIEFRPYVENVQVVNPASPHIITADSASAPAHPSHNIYKIEIDYPPQTYYVNYKPLVDWSTGAFEFSGEVLTVEVASNATVRVVADPVDGYQDGPAPQYINIDVLGVNNSGLYAENPAHAIVWAHTQEHCGAQPLATVNAASAQAAADWFYAQGFGICTLRYPDKESAAEFIRRIERVAGCSWTQNRADGQWYIDIANGQYVLEDLPILNDDDIVSFEEVPTVLDEAVNSVSVKYFDPQRKEAITTPPLRAMGLVAEFGTIHQTYEFPELPTDALANRVANRELLARCTPTRVFNLVTTRKTAGWRRNTYFRLQSPKRGIADMVCLLAEANDGSLRSGAVQIKATQDIYSLPATVYTETEQGVDTRPPSEPVPATAQLVFEAPYVDVVAALPAAEFEALADDAGFAVGVAANPGGMLDFTMRVDAGAGFANAATGDFCKTATLAADLPPQQKTAIALASASGLAGVEVGSACIVGAEWCRVDAIDTGANTIALGRGCADTVPALHLAGTRIYFYASAAAADPTEYTDGEAIDIKLLPRTGSKQLADADAATLPLTFARRLARPYPPGNLMINGLPFYGTGNTAPPTSGGGGGGGPPQAPATTPTGTPASTTLGPNGGYADNAPHPVPQPTVYSTDLIPDGTLSGWTDPDGRPLGGQWSIEAGGMVYQGAAPSSAVYEPAKLRMSQYPLPRWQITVSAEIQTEIGQRAALGVAWGTSNASAFPYSDASTPQEYPVPTTVTHTYAPAVTRAGLSYPNLDVIQLVMPLLVADARGTSRTSFRDVSMTVEEVPTPVTVASIANLDFSAGLTGWTQWPAPGALTPTLAVVPGGVKATGVSADGAFTFLINDDPITLVDAPGKALRMLGEFWSNDPTVITPPGVPRNGASLQIAVKPPGGEYIVLPWQSSSMYRGDWTPREIWQIAEVATAAGTSVHLAIRLQQSVGYSSGVRNISVAVTDDPVA